MKKIIEDSRGLKLHNAYYAPNSEEFARLERRDFEDADRAIELNNDGYYNSQEIPKPGYSIRIKSLFNFVIQDEYCSFRRFKEMENRHWPRLFIYAEKRERIPRRLIEEQEVEAKDLLRLREGELFGIAKPDFDLYSKINTYNESERRLGPVARQMGNFTGVGISIDTHDTAELTNLPDKLKSKVIVGTIKGDNVISHKYTRVKDAILSLISENGKKPIFPRLYRIGEFW